MIRTSKPRAAPKRPVLKRSVLKYPILKYPILKRLGSRPFGFKLLATLIGLSTLCSALATGAPATDTLGTDTMSGGALPFLLEPEVPAPRDIEIAELPFLVEEPPTDPNSDPDAPVTPEVPAPITGSAEGALNPFAPLLSPQLPAPDVASPPPAPRAAEIVPEIAPEIVEVPVPPEPPSSPTAPAEAPVPGARVPTVQATAQETALPRRLAGRLPNTPDTPDARSTLVPLGGASSERAWQGALTEVVVVRPPPGGVGAPPFGQNVGQNTGQNTASSPGAPEGFSTRARNALATPAPISLSRSAQNVSPGDTEAARYLDEQQVSFTAMSTGTGIFRTASSSAPILLAVGEALPGSQVVLVELTQSTAAFAHAPLQNGARDDARHTLSLRP